MNRRSSTSTKVFVGSLPPGTTTDELRELFSPYGDIAECDVVNRCGFLHLENKQLAFKAIDELNNSTFKGTRISVEKGRVKPPPNRDGGRGGRNGFGPMRNNRDNYRGGPYMRDGGDFERRGPPRGGYGGGRGGFDRGGFDRQNMRGMNDGYGNGRPYMDDRRGGAGGGYNDDRRYDGGYNMGPGGDDRMYEDRNMYQDDRRPPLPSMDQRPPPFERRPAMDDRKPNNFNRRPLMEPQGPGLGATPAGPMNPIPPMNQGYDRRPQPDMYSRRDGPPKPLGAAGGYDAARNTGYDSYSAPMQNRGYSGPGPRRDIPPRRF